MRRTLETGIRPRPSPGRPHSGDRAVGFTLIELLVVVAITGIVLAVAAVNLWPSDAEVARREVGYVALELEKTRDDAWFGGRPTALTFDQGRLRHWRLGVDRTWAAMPARDRVLGEVAVIGLFVEGVPLSPSDRLVFLADGFAQPFRLELEVRSISRSIDGDAAGSMKLGGQ